MGSGSFTSTSTGSGTAGLFTGIGIRGIGIRGIGICGTGIRGIGITASSISSNLVLGLRRGIQAINRLAQGQSCPMPASPMWPSLWPSPSQPSPSQPSPSQGNGSQINGSRMLNTLGDRDRTSDHSPKTNGLKLASLKLVSLKLASLNSGLESSREYTTQYQSGWWSPTTALTFS